MSNFQASMTLTVIAPDGSTITGDWRTIEEVIKFLRVVSKYSKLIDAMGDAEFADVFMNGIYEAGVKRAINRSDYDHDPVKCQP